MRISRVGYGQESDLTAAQLRGPQHVPHAGVGPDGDPVHRTVPVQLGSDILHSKQMVLNLEPEDREMCYLGSDARHGLCNGGCLDGGGAGGLLLAVRVIVMLNLSTAQVIIPNLNWIELWKRYFGRQES